MRNSIQSKTKQKTLPNKQTIFRKHLNPKPQNNLICLARSIYTKWGVHSIYAAMFAKTNKFRYGFLTIQWS